MTTPTLAETVTYRLRSTGQRPLTVNRVATLHRQAWAKLTADTRGEWHLLALEAKVPRLVLARVTAVPLHADRRSPQDVSAMAPEVKAAVDGLVDARVLVDDTAEHLLSITFLPPDVCGVDGMELVIEGVPR